MPVVLRRGPFRVVIYLPPREHGPPHVHVLRAGADVVIALGQGDDRPSVKRVYGMPGLDIVRAFRLVEDNLDLLRVHWSKYHDPIPGANQGNPPSGSRREGPRGP